jgi:RNA polymerase sigma-70 factor (ECF subfamily)
VSDFQRWRVDEAELLRRTARGDESAFGEIYARHSPAVYRYALRMTSSQDMAEEVVQDVFLHVVKGCRGFDPAIGPLASYLYGLARNRLARLWPDQAEVPLEDFDLAVDEPDALEGLSREQQVEAVRTAVGGLPLAYREVVVLCDLEEMSYAAAAEMLGVETGTVRSRLHRARKMLLEKLKRSGVKV